VLSVHSNIAKFSVTITVVHLILVASSSCAAIMKEDQLLVIHCVFLNP
jgi:hypothetical protein